MRWPHTQCPSWHPAVPCEAPVVLRLQLRGWRGSSGSCSPPFYSFLSRSVHRSLIISMYTTSADPLWSLDVITARQLSMLLRVRMHLFFLPHATPEPTDIANLLPMAIVWGSDAVYQSAQVWQQHLAICPACSMPFIW